MNIFFLAAKVVETPENLGELTSDVGKPCRKDGASYSHAWNMCPNCSQAFSFSDGCVRPLQDLLRDQ